jgi:hypothetical protein
MRLSKEFSVDQVADAVEVDVDEVVGEVADEIAVDVSVGGEARRAEIRVPFSPSPSC